jgi:hypothetical protein
MRAANVAVRCLGPSGLGVLIVIWSTEMLLDGMVGLAYS